MRILICQLKTLCLLFAAFLLGWFFAGTNILPSNLAKRRMSFPLPISSDDSALSMFLPSTISYRRSHPNVRTSSWFTNIGLYREVLRRRSIRTVGYMWNVAFVGLRKIREITKLNGTLDQFSLHINFWAKYLETFLKDSTLYILANLHQIEELDNANTRRKEELGRLSNIVQARIRTLQNPRDCSRAKILLADVSWPCGYGCHAHYFMFCLNMAYATGRTLISESLKTYCGKWWAESYMPFSDKCSMNDVQKDEQIVGMNSANFRSSARVMRCTLEFFLHAQNVSVAPPMVPSDLAPFLLALHGQPAVWFLGQLAHYIMRPLPGFKSQLDALALSSNISANNDYPIVGVHVRRTDKVSYNEASFHNLSEYMVHVDRYFDYVDEMRSLEIKKGGSRKPKVQRQIYLASDDPSVFNEMKAHYPHYVVHNTTRNKLIALAARKFPTDSRTHIAMEIFLLSLTDYIVCTLSSNVCRVAYELKQAQQKKVADAGDLIQTIDTSYFWDSGQTMECEMVQDEEIMNLHRGDIVDIWSGNLNARFEQQRLKNKTHFIDPPYKCAPRTRIGEVGVTFAPLNYP